MDNVNPPKQLVENLQVAIECYNEAIKVFKENECKSEYEIRLNMFKKRLSILCSDCGLTKEDVSNTLNKMADECRSVD